MDKIKRAEPNLPVANNKEDLKEMVQEISKCFTITEDGELRVDENKIDPSAITIKDKQLMKFTKEELEANENNKRKLKELERILMRNPASLIVLEKTAKIFNKVHYLVIVYKQERIVGEDAMSSLTNYEQYDVSYKIELKNLSKKSDSMYITLSEANCRQFFGTKEDAEVARYIIKKLNLFDNKMCLPILTSMDKADMLAWENKQITFYNQKALELIQKFITNRHFLVAFKKYKEMLKQLNKEADIILRETLSLENNWYHAVVYLSSSYKNFKVALWSARNYSLFKLKVSKEFSVPYIKFKEVFAEVLLKNLYFLSGPNEQMTLRYNHKSIPNKINKALALYRGKKIQMKGSGSPAKDN